MTFFHISAAPHSYRRLIIRRSIIQFSSSLSLFRQVIHNSMVTCINLRHLHHSLASAYQQIPSKVYRSGADTLQSIKRIQTAFMHPFQAASRVFPSLLIRCFDRAAIFSSYFTFWLCGPLSNNGMILKSARSFLRRPMVILQF